MAAAFARRLRRGVWRVLPRHTVHYEFIIPLFRILPAPLPSRFQARDARVPQPPVPPSYSMPSGAEMDRSAAASIGRHTQGCGPFRCRCAFSRCTSAPGHRAFQYLFVGILVSLACSIGYSPFPVSSVLEPHKSGSLGTWRSFLRSTKTSIHRLPRARGCDT